jgi:hypothetical protein
MLRLAASLADGIPAAFASDGRSARLAAGAVLHASGHRDVP